MFDKIAERRLWLVDPKYNSKIELCIEIGRPRWGKSGSEAVCPVYVHGFVQESLNGAICPDYSHGLMKKPQNIFGMDLLNALECGLMFAESELKRLSENMVVQWPGGEQYYSECGK